MIFPYQKIFVDAGIHAREWAAPITALYLMKKIVEHENTLHKKISIYIIPVVNPDGYEYSHTVDRFWRKTRSRINGTECVGTDANRNFNSHWTGICLLVNLIQINLFNYFFLFVKMYKEMMTCLNFYIYFLMCIFEI